MKCFPTPIGLIAILMAIVPTTVFAGWQVASKGEQAPFPAEPFFQTAAPQQGTAFMPVQGSNAFSTEPGSLNRPSSMYAISISGSLKENIERIMDRYHWKVIWKSPYDYNFDGRVTGSSLPNVIGKLFQPFPLQAQFYMSNRTMIVILRNKHEAT